MGEGRLAKSWRLRWRVWDGPEKRSAETVWYGAVKLPEDVVIARYAVEAFARERQRRFKRSSGPLWARVLGAAFWSEPESCSPCTHSNDRKRRRQWRWPGFAALVLASTWRTWQAARNVEAAEQLDREYLRRSGAPYVPGGPPTRVYVPPLAFACSLAIHVAAIVVVGGVLTLLLRAEPFSVGRALSVGVSGGVGAAIAAAIGVIAARSRDETSEEGRSIVEYQHLRDLD